MALEKLDFVRNIRYAPIVIIVVVWLTAVFYPIARQMMVVEGDIAWGQNNDISQPHKWLKTHPANPLAYIDYYYTALNCSIFNGPER